MFNRQEILEKSKKRYSKEKPAEYYLQNKEVIKEKARSRYKNLPEEEKNKIKEYQKKRYQEFHKSKQAISLDPVDSDQIVVSNKFKHSEEGFKYFIGYKEDAIVKPLCIILPQMNGYINTLKTVERICFF